MALQNGTRITAELRRSQVLQLKQAGASEQAIADQLGVSKTQINNDVKRRLLLRWWSQATGPDDTQAARATGIVLDILRRLDTIGGLVPDKPLIQFNQQNVMVGAVTFADLLREAMAGPIMEAECADTRIDLAVEGQERADG